MIAQRQCEDRNYAGWYNVGPDERDCVTTGELADMFCAAWGEGATWENRAEENAPHEANFLKLDCTKLKTTFGWRPKLHIGEAVEKTAAEAMIGDEAVKEVSDAQEKPAEALEASEEAPAGFGTGLTSMENENGDSDMIDLNALYSKRMEEAFEDLGIGMQETPAAVEEGEPLPEVMYQAGPEDIYAYQDGNMQFYGPEEEYYAPGDYPQGVYMNETEQMFMDMGNLYSEDMYEDDSDAYAQLYNSVNNYDVNGATQEMPINEVLAYRNAFTNEYINEELSGESLGDGAQKADAPGKKGKKAKRKSFFSGLFGKRSTDDVEDQDSLQEQDDYDEAPSEAGQATPPEPVYLQQTSVPDQDYIGVDQDLSAMGPAPTLPEYDPELASQMGSYEAPNYYDLKF